MKSHEKRNGTTIRVECTACPWTPGAAEAIPRVVLKVAIHDMMGVAMAHAWENEGHATRVVVDGRWLTRHVMRRRGEVNHG
ncbi:MAG: hypothetical protein IH822_05890 [Chloroflexi bacterium]|nr:hypothetical protein [Chloroflexota bacterium]